MFNPPRVNLAILPTPLHRLNHISETLGTEVWIKRDDLTGFALGGNKARKLEYLVADAIAHHANEIVTCGALQSNFIRQLGAACSAFGIHCTAVVMDLPFNEVPVEAALGRSLGSSSGNVYLGELFGINMIQLPNGTWDELYAATQREADQLREKGRAVYEIPVGGSSVLGAFSFMKAGEELDAQVAEKCPFPRFRRVFTASSSGSTQTGLGYHFHGSETEVIGIACDPEPDLVEEFIELADGLDAALGRSRHLGVHDFRFELGYVGEGYGISTPEGEAALKFLARTEGILLDTVYSAKAFAGMLDIIRNSEESGPNLFWHTGGVPTIFAR